MPPTVVRRIPLVLAMLAVTALIAAPSAQADIAASSEFRVNTTTAVQDIPAVASDADGDSVVVWIESSVDYYGIFARRYNSAGSPLGGQFRVSGTAGSGQSRPDVAMDAQGNFTVTWESYEQDGSSNGVYAQRFSNTGSPVGGEFRVNTYTAESQRQPSIAMDADGDTIITWTSDGQDGSDNGIYGQRYTNTGTPVGGEFRVNTRTESAQFGPAVAMDADGDAIITWTSSGQDGSDNGIYAQRYTNTGTAVGGEFRVNTVTASAQSEQAVAIDADGDFTITWISSDGSMYGIYAQRYTNTGTPVGTELRVNTYVTSDQRHPAIAMDADGDATITWTSHKQDGSMNGIYAQRYTNTGSTRGNEFRVNTTTARDQFRPAVAMDADGDAIITWTSSDIYAKRFRGPAPVDVGLSQSTPEATATAGQNFTYALRVTNLAVASDWPPTGIAAIDAALGSATGVRVFAQIPAGATFVSGSGTGWSCKTGATIVTCKRQATLAAGAATPQLRLTYTMPAAAGTVEHGAQVVINQDDTTQANNTSIVQTPVESAP